MQQAITLPYPVVTASPAPSLCPRCGVVRRAQKTPVEADWRGVIVMLVPLAAALSAWFMTAQWIAATGVLSWLP